MSLSACLIWKKELVMFRSVAAITALLILPSLALAQDPDPGQQQAQVTHEVDEGETLWALASRYLGDPHRWVLIYEANRDRIPDPDALEVGTVLVIPSLPGREAAATAETPEAAVEVEEAEPAQVQDVRVVTPAQEARPRQQAGERCPGPGQRTVFYEGTEGTRGCAVDYPEEHERTAFYRDPTAVMAGDVLEDITVTRYAVPRPVVYGAPRRLVPGEEPRVLGTLTELASGVEGRAFRDRAIRYEKLNISPEPGASLRVGDVLQAYRVEERGPRVGRVLHPTGIVTVTSVEDAGVVVALSHVYGEVRVGNRVKAVPDYDLRPGVKARETATELTGSIVGFAREAPHHSTGAVAFLDIGTADGVSVGDEFRVLTNAGEGWSGLEAARLQVILAEGNSASARVVHLTYPVLERGLQVHLVQKVQ